ncbi:hypothetical protein [Listeria monocytogenes]|nr:hypothetical protein [Listeria monocytogenes]EXL14589.1 hypothetical protein X844_1614 [Listeria monocytogenes Lm_1823]EXL20080.1 hypothetical protein X847_2760 [Listeria monocytogenes Lm_1889]KSZ43522.1 hypothetical protein AOB47_573c [Listeria monocytogenes]KSZ48680.1 hypothetical protein AOA13_341c [Listeria monocytogenes]
MIFKFIFYILVYVESFHFSQEKANNVRAIIPVSELVLSLGSL